MSRDAVRASFATLPEFESPARRPLGMTLTDFGSEKRTSQVPQSRDVDRFQLGYDAGSKAARQQFEAQMAALGEEFESRQATDRLAWKKEIGEGLQGAVDAGLANLFRGLSDEVAAILTPYLMELTSARATVAFEAAIEKATVAGVRVQLTGGGDWAKAIQQRLGARGIECDVMASGEVALTAKIDTTEIRTVFGDWLEELKAIAA